MIARSNCTRCWAGTYQTGHGSVNASDCLLCPTGHYQTGLAMIYKWVQAALSIALFPSTLILRAAASPATNNTYTVRSQRSQTHVDIGALRGDSSGSPPLYSTVS